MSWPRISSNLRFLSVLELIINIGNIAVFIKRIYFTRKAIMGKAIIGKAIIGKAILKNVQLKGNTILHMNTAVENIQILLQKQIIWY